MTFCMFDRLNFLRKTRVLTSKQPFLFKRCTHCLTFNIVPHISNYARNFIALKKCKKYFKRTKKIVDESKSKFYLADQKIYYIIQHKCIYTFTLLA